MTSGWCRISLELSQWSHFLIGWDRHQVSTNEKVQLIEYFDGLPYKLISICLVWYFEHFAKIFESLWSKWYKRKIISIMWRCFSTPSCWKFDRFFPIEIFYVILYSHHKVGCVFPMITVSILPHGQFGPNNHREDVSHVSLQGLTIRVHKYRPRGKL